MKWFKDINTIDQLRNQYRMLLHKYHPDNNTEDTTVQMQEINAEYDTVFSRLKDDFEHSDTYNNASDWQKQKSHQTYDWQKDRQIREMIAKLIRLENIQIEICGVWIWVSNCFEVRKELKELQFRYASQKKMWYWHNDEYYKYSKKTVSMEHIRERYGSVKINTGSEEERQNKRIKA